MARDGKRCMRGTREVMERVHGGARVGVVVNGMGLGLILWRETVRSDFKGSCLPSVAIVAIWFGLVWNVTRISQRTYCSCSIFPAAH